MVKSDPVLHRAVCDHCGKISHQVFTSASKAHNCVLDFPHSPIGRPWVEIDGKLCCDECGVRLLGTEEYLTATAKRATEVRALAATL